MRSWSYTGRRRHRSEKRWGKERLILQVEVKGYVTSCIGGQIDTDYCNAWRDATTADLTVMGETPP